ncbi:uncharacterized protein LOC115209215 [Argonauta hians]
MSESVNPAHTPTSHCLSPPCFSSPPLDNHLACISSELHSSSNCKSRESSETELTMGNQLSGEGSLKRKIKKKNKNKNEEKNKNETDSVFNENVVGAFGESPVDNAASPNKRPNQAKSPRPVRSTYDNVNQQGSITNLCSNTALCTSDLYLDTVSRLDVSMTTSQTEPSQRNDRLYQFNTQLPDNISFSEMSFCESGFITPALSTPQVKRNELHPIATPTDTVSELGKEIERAIFERLYAEEKSDLSEMKSVDTALVSCKKEVEITPHRDVNVNPKQLEYINEETVQTNKTCVPKSNKNKVTEVRVEPIGSQREDIWPAEMEKEKFLEMINKADWELMEKESKITCKKSTRSDSEPTTISLEKHSDLLKLQPEQNLSSSDECSKKDFENVKLHINEDVNVLLEDNHCDKREGVQSDDNKKSNEHIFPEPLEEKQTVILTPEIVTKVEEDVLLNESITDVEGGPTENRSLTENEVETKGTANDEIQLDKNSETQVIYEAEDYYLKNEETAAAAIATKPAIPEEILTTPKVAPPIKSTSVEDREPVSENLIECSSVSLVEQANIVTNKSVPVLKKEHEKKSPQSKTNCDDVLNNTQETIPKANSETNTSIAHSRDSAKQKIKQTHKGTLVEAESSLECSVGQTTGINDENKKEITQSEQNILKTKTKKARKRKRKKKSSQGDESSANCFASENQSVSEVTEIEDNGDLAISKPKQDDQTKDNSNDTESFTNTTGSDSPVFQHQSPVIENTNYLADKRPDIDQTSENSSPFQENKLVDYKEITRPSIDISCAAGALHSNSDILSDESTPTDERLNKIRDFYFPNKQLKDERNPSDVEGGKEKNTRLQVELENKEVYEENKDICQLIDQSDVDVTQHEDGNENVFTKDEDADIVITRSPSGTKNTDGETVNPRLSTASEELNEIMENSNKLEKRSDQNRPHSYPKESEDRRDVNENLSANSSVSQESHDSCKKNSSKSGHASLTDIDHNLPETLPELADLKNFLDYIKLGENQKSPESYFPYKGETNRSSPSENASSRRLSRISPAVTERSVTESDIDISEQRDDMSTDSNIFADDEDESASELLFTKTYTEPDKGGEVLVSCTIVNTAADDDSDDFWAEHSASEEVYRQIESSTKVVTTVFDNARLQMQDIHTHLQNLRLQMENLQESLDNASIFTHDYYAEDTPESSQDFYPLDNGFIVSQEYFPKHIASVTTEEYSPVELGPVLTKEYYSSHFGKPPFL